MDFNIPDYNGRKKNKEKKNSMTMTHFVLGDSYWIIAEI